MKRKRENIDNGDIDRNKTKRRKKNPTVLDALAAVSLDKSYIPRDFYSLVLATYIHTYLELKTTPLIMVCKYFHVIIMDKRSTVTQTFIPRLMSGITTHMSDKISASHIPYEYIVDKWPIRDIIFHITSDITCETNWRFIISKENIPQSLNNEISNFRNSITNYEFHSNGSESYFLKTSMEIIDKNKENTTDIKLNNMQKMSCYFNKKKQYLLPENKAMIENLTPFTIAANAIKTSQNTSYPFSIDTSIPINQNDCIFKMYNVNTNWIFQTNKSLELETNKWLDTPKLGDYKGNIHINRYLNYEYQYHRYTFFDKSISIINYNNNNVKEKKKEEMSGNMNYYHSLDIISLKSKAAHAITKSEQQILLDTRTGKIYGATFVTFNVIKTACKNNILSVDNEKSRKEQSDKFNSADDVIYALIAYMSSGVTGSKRINLWLLGNIYTDYNVNNIVQFAENNVKGSKTAVLSWKGNNIKPFPYVLEGVNKLIKLLHESEECEQLLSDTLRDIGKQHRESDWLSKYNIEWCYKKYAKRLVIQLIITPMENNIKCEGEKYSIISIHKTTGKITMQLYDRITTRVIAYSPCNKHDEKKYSNLYLTVHNTLEMAKKLINYLIHYNLPSHFVDFQPNKSRRRRGRI